MLMSRLDAYISRYGDFCANDNNDDNDDTTDYFTPCACARGNYLTNIEAALLKSFQGAYKNHKATYTCSLPHWVLVFGQWMRPYKSAGRRGQGA